ncbi:hypothetical protein ASE00_02980 [Sphingomonas sp. Root710]|uniref:AcvB/VirJ family lysyl-phosphatidylglycerol hydrolase n=1 Tax=Sphingomonas sp. Root710 TaxID=1736594 RepID=UPI0006F6D680|nr:AcvB/VirJ family lysyl-phosphatidylglycerol hydrolase [Sphingomonas sp. Root710]KRB85752.1 hypothetical protein ASE00_02980 [Sphingomonas sp. Root710]
MMAVGAVVAAVVIRSNRAGPHHLAITIAAITTLLGGAVGYVAYLGYFGGELFRETPAKYAPGPGKPARAVVIFSGDMGFNTGMGPAIEKRLSADGIAVVSVNSLSFFRSRRDPRQAADLIAAAMARAMALGRVDRVALIGQSFGADMLQAGLSVAPPELRRHVAMVALVVPGETLSFRASPSNLFSFGDAEQDAVPSARQLGWVPTICIFGSEETDSLCPHLPETAARRVELPGGHPLHHDDAAVYAVLRRAIDKALPTR